MTSTESSFRIEPHVWRIASVVVLGSIMSILDTTIVNVALATLSRDLNASLSEIQWVLTGYMLSLAAVIPLTGWAARRFGPKNVYILALILFTAGSVLCGFATSATELTLFRVLQGLGGGMLLPVGQMMMASAAGPQRMGRVMSIVAIPAMLAPILGPVLGGVIVDNASWRWIFFVNLPVGILALVLALRFLPQGERAPAHRLDVVGFALMSLGLPLLTYGLAEIGATGHFLIPRVLVPLIAGLALVATFIVHALRTRFPLLDLRLYRRATFASASTTMFFLGAAVFGGTILLPLYLQEVRGESVLDTGLLTAPLGLGMVLVLPIIGRLTDRYGGGPLALFGIVVTTLATVPFGLVDAHTSLWSLSIAMVFRGIGVGFAFMPAMTAAFASLDRSELPDATPQMNVLQRVGGSIGTAVLAVVLQRTLAGTTSPAHAYGVAFWWSVGLTAVAIVPTVILFRSERAARRTTAEAPAPLPAEALAEAV